jgi:riboflavin kinase/FMN adenylyltransferase
MDLEIVPPLELLGGIVSSSRVRDLVAAGRLEDARELLTAPYRIRGLVTHGVGRGAKLGFPTANLEGIDTLLPGDGVYAGRALTADGRTFPAAIHVGPNPTFGESVPKVEAHLIGCDRPLYGEVLEVDFLARLRDTHPFAGPDALAAQLARDAAAARQIACADA